MTLDARLAAFTIAFAAGCAAGTVRHDPSPAAAFLALFAALLVGVFRPRGLVCLVAAASLAGLGWGLLASHSVDSSLLAQLARSGPPSAPVHVEVDLEAVREGSPAAHGATVFEATVRRIRVTGDERRHALAERVLVVAGGGVAVEPGDGIRALATIDLPDRRESLRRRHVGAVLRVRDVIATWRPSNPVLRLTNSLRSLLRDGARKRMDGDRAALLTGLLTGDTRGLGDAARDDLRATGLSHLVAVSGANVAWVLGATAFVLARAGAPRSVRLSLLALALLIFVVLTGWQPSVLRAGAMAALGILVALAGRGRPAPGDLLAAAATCLLVLDPFLLWSAGFQLSCAATLGLLVVSPRVRRRLPARPGWVGDAVAATLGAQVAVVPVLVALGGRLSLVSVLANVAAVPAAVVASVWGFPACIGASLVPAFAPIVHVPTALSVEWILGVSRRLSGIPFAEVRLTGTQPFLFGAAVLSAGLFAARRRPGGAIGVALLLALLTAGHTAPPRGTRVVAFDVGQGDAILVSEAAGRSVLVDGGPDPDLLLRRLSEEGVLALDVVVLTHPHLDHVGGLVGALRRVPVGAVLEGPASADGPEYAEFLREVESRGIRHSRVSRGDRMEIGSLSIDVIAPDRAASGTRSDANNSSLVMRVHAPGGIVLLLGDAEVVEQEDLLRWEGPEGVRADVMKVAHHGSSYQLPALLAAVDARLALVSVGSNDYGHPSPAVIDALAGAGALVRRTDLDGTTAATLHSDGSLVIESAGGATRAGSVQSA